MRYDLKELIDVARLQELTDHLYRAAGIPSSIITMDGEILTGSGWQRICTDFHRQHPEIEKACIASDIAIRKKVDEGDPFARYTCPCGLTDASIPINIEGEHVANAFAGQLFLEPPDESVELHFRETAREFGFDEEDYMAAFREIPVIPLERFRPALLFLVQLAEMIAGHGLRRIRELEALAKLRDSTQIIEGIINAIPARVFWKDKELHYLGCNAAFARDAGHADPRDLIGKNDFQMGWRLQAEAYRADDRAVIESGSPRLLIEEVQTTPEGDVISLLTSKLPLRNSEGEIVGVLGTYLDITERKLEQEELRESRDRLRELTARLDEVREEERTVLARELHDEVGQNLTALRMDLSGIEAEIPDEMKHLTDRLRSMIAITQDSVDQVNRLSDELRSPILDMLGLKDAVESEVWDYEKRWSTEVDLEIDLDGIETSPDVDLTAFRILKESLANVRLHAQASRVEVKLKVTGDSLELIISDDGRGITDRAIKAPSSFGLMGMSERADRVGGKVEIQRGEERGTLVRAVIPIHLGNSGST